MSVKDEKNGRRQDDVQDLAIVEIVGDRVGKDVVRGVETDAGQEVEIDVDLAVEIE